MRDAQSIPVEYHHIGKSPEGGICPPFLYPATVRKLPQRKQHYKNPMRPNSEQCYLRRGEQVGDGKPWRSKMV